MSRVGQVGAVLSLRESSQLTTKSHKALQVQCLLQSFCCDRTVLNEGFFFVSGVCMDIAMVNFGGERVRGFGAVLTTGV